MLRVRTFLMQWTSAVLMPKAPGTWNHPGADSPTTLADATKHAIYLRYLDFQPHAATPSIWTLLAWVGVPFLYMGTRALAAGWLSIH